jgi:hydroxyacylglutathione hydrolase
MEHQIITVKLDFNFCYIIRGKGTILIDGGPPGKAKSFFRQLAKKSVSPEEIKLIVLTHGDWDHVGSARDIKSTTGAQIAIHENDRLNLEQGRFNWPGYVTGWGKIFRAAFYPYFSKIPVPAVKADIVLGEQEMPLTDFGINGKIIHTPGHTSGSISVLLENGDAFVGCLTHNKLPFRFSPGFPIFAEDIEMVKKSWKMIIDKGAKMIYPGHGNPFPVDRILKHL